MRNSEHYRDPTAGEAIRNVEPHDPSEKPKWNSTPAYVAERGTKVQKVIVDGFHQVSISEMDMDEVKKHLRSCAKSNGDPLVCVGCSGGCVFGRRAKELLDQMTDTRENRMEEAKRIGRKRGAQANMHKAVLEYKEAIESGDPIQYILAHSKLSGDEAARKILAKQKLRRWERDYGGLVKATAKAPKQEPVPVKEFVESASEPHLMQMPCLSKKVAAELAEEAKKGSDNASIMQMFSDKLASLKAARDDVQAKIDELFALKDTYTNQIAAMITTADCLDISIEAS